MMPVNEKTGHADKKSVDLSIYIPLFLEQAREFLSLLWEQLDRLEIDSADPEALHGAHRATHTLKGMASTMRFDALVEQAAAMVQIFAPEQPVTPEQISDARARCRAFEADLVRLEQEQQA